MLRAHKKLISRTFNLLIFRSYGRHISIINNFKDMTVNYIENVIQVLNSKAISSMKKIDFMNRITKSSII